MRFVSPHLNIEYTVVPASRIIQPGQPVQAVRGLRARFEGGAFDSEQAQRVLHWSDGERQTVEQYLLRHEDFGRRRGIFVSSDEAPALGHAESAEGCAFALVVGVKSERCGKPTKGEALYCPEHLALLEDPVVPKRKEAVSA